MIYGVRVLTEDDGFNDEEALDAACKKLEAEGFFEEVARRHGLELRSPVDSQAKPDRVISKKSSGVVRGR
jgi:hypothetical protein